MSIAPWQVQVCAIDPHKPGVGEAADKLVGELEALGIEVLYDDRGEKAGSMFSDADLLGIPLRLVISPKTLAEGEAEFRTRACRDSVRFKLDEAAKIIADKVRAELAEFEC
jgi:prolyl-tRNA synthetase